MQFPSYPQTAAEIYNFRGKGEYLACAIVHRYDTRQLMAFRELRIALGEANFREALAEGLDILAHSSGIHTPAGWLYSFIKKEVQR